MTIKIRERVRGRLEKTVNGKRFRFEAKRSGLAVRRKYSRTVTVVPWERILDTAAVIETHQRVLL